MKMAVFCGAARTSEDKEKLLLKKKKFDEKGFETVVLDSDALVVSSSEIREKIARGEDAKKLISPEVSEFIKKKGLYGSN